MGSGQTVTVKYVVHSKQEDGGWKWRVDIWNTNDCATLHELQSGLLLRLMRSDEVYIQP